MDLFVFFGNFSLFTVVNHHRSPPSTSLFRIEESPQKNMSFVLGEFVADSTDGVNRHGKKKTPFGRNIFCLSKSKDVGFDPQDSRMMHFGDDQGEPNVSWRVREPVPARLELLGVEFSKHILVGVLCLKRIFWG